MAAHAFLGKSRDLRPTAVDVACAEPMASVWRLAAPAKHKALAFQRESAWNRCLRFGGLAWAAGHVWPTNLQRHRKEDTAHRAIMGNNVPRWVRFQQINLVDPACSHMLVAKIKPCGDKNIANAMVQSPRLANVARACVKLFASI